MRRLVQGLLVELGGGDWDAGLALQGLALQLR